MAYFVIYQGEDDLVMEQLDAAELNKRLNDNEYPTTEWGMTFAKKIPWADMSEWAIGTLLIIKGDIVVPKPVQVVKEWEL